MSHSMTYLSDDDGQEYIVSANGDFSGLIQIDLALDTVDAPPVATLPADLLVFIVGEMVRSYRLARVESLDSRTLVTLPPSEDTR